MLAVSLITRGSPDQLTGGHLYQRRMAERAAAHDASIEFVTVHGLHNPLRRAHGVIVVDSIAAWSVAPWATFRSPRQPLAAILHQAPGGVDQGMARTAWQASLDRALYRRCDLLITPSDALADEIVDRHHLCHDRVQVIEPGSDLPVRRPSSQDLRCGRRIALLSVANWLANKGIVELLDAVATLPSDYVTLHLVGRVDVDRHYEARVRARIRQPDLARRVIVHGLLEPPDLAALYAAADVFVLPSFSETYGIVYGEALRAGLPVVGWHAGNLPRLIDDGGEGRLVATGDVHSLGLALGQLAGDDTLRARMAQRADARGRRLPTWDSAAQTFFGALSRLSETSR